MMPQQTPFRYAVVFSDLSYECGFARMFHTLEEARNAASGKDSHKVQAIYKITEMVEHEFSFISAESIMGERILGEPEHD